MFNKYPKITAQQKNTLPAGHWIVQEKLDGSNAGIAYESSCDVQFLMLHSRNVALARIKVASDHVSVTALTGEYGAFGTFVGCVSENARRIAQVMSETNTEHLYGEWLVPHTITYPTYDYNRFYVFDAVRGGKFFEPDIMLMSGLETTGFIQDVPSYYMPVVTPVTQDDVTRATDYIARLASMRGRSRIEGVVLKLYSSELDQFGQRYCYKHVLPEFREDHAKNAMFPAPKDPLSTEQRLCDALPDRSIEKTFEKLLDAHGAWENRLIPKLLGMVWQEFFEEHLIGALQQAKMPLVNTRELRAIVDKRTREFALARAAQGVAA